jgi:N-acetylneuraminic acid mutarotase
LFAKDTVQVIVSSQYSTCDIDSRPVIQAHLVPLGKLSIGRVNIITAAANNKILFAGGSSYYKDSTGIPIRRVDVYDINSNSWSMKDLYKYPTWRLDMGIAAVNNKIFIAGGGFWGDDIYTNQVDIYNASDNSWSSAVLSEFRSATTGVSAGNKVLFAGGYSFNNGSNYWSNTVDIFDNEANKWTTATLSERRGYPSAVAAGDKIYFAGGQKNDGQFVPSDRIDEYDILTNSWSTSTLQQPLHGVGAISAGDKVFFAGGQSTSGESGTVEIRDVVTGTTSFDCIIPRAGLSAVLKDDKIVFFTGSGSDPRNGTHFEIYNLTTHTWYTGLLGKSIERAAIISVNNVIYVAGGFVNGIGSDQVWKLEF